MFTGIVPRAETWSNEAREVPCCMQARKVEDVGGRSRALPSRKHGPRSWSGTVVAPHLGQRFAGTAPVGRGNVVPVWSGVADGP